MSRHLTYVCSLLVAVLLVAACGGGAPPSSQVDLNLHDAEVGTPLVTQGGFLGLRFYVTNDSAVASPDFTARISISPSGGGSGTTLSDRAMMGIAAGVTHTFSGSIPVPESVGTGSYTVVIELDPDRKLPLLNRGNDRVEITGALEVQEPVQVDMCENPGDSVSFADPVVHAYIEDLVNSIGDGEMTCANVAQIEHVFLSGMGITSLDGVQNLTGVTLARFNDNDIVDASYLVGMTSLEWLEMNSNQITSLESLRGRQNLLGISANNNQLASLDPIATIPSLLNVSFLNNPFTTVPDLSLLTNLSYLTLGSKSLVNADGVAGLSAITNLYIHSSSLASLEPFSSLTTLETLMLRESDLDDVAALAGLSNLAFLDVTANNITDATPFRTMTGLVQLSADDNKLSDLGPFAANTGIGGATTLNFRRNCFPVTEEGDLVEEQFGYYENLVGREITVNWEPAGTTEWCDGI